MLDLLSPQAINMTLFASIIFLTPSVIAVLGVLSKPEKSPLAATLVI